MNIDLIMLKSYKAYMQLDNLFDKYRDGRLNDEYLKYQFEIVNLYKKNDW